MGWVFDLAGMGIENWRMGVVDMGVSQICPTL
jgi:hypothetical protein